MTKNKEAQNKKIEIEVTNNKEGGNAKAVTLSIAQEEIAREISLKLALNLQIVQSVILEEQKLTMQYVANGVKVIKKNYLILEKRMVPARKIISPLNKKEYAIPEKATIRIRLGQGFKDYVSNQIKNQFEPICRFVKRTDKS